MDHKHCKTDRSCGKNWIKVFYNGWNKKPGKITLSASSVTNWNYFNFDYQFHVLVFESKPILKWYL